MKTPPLPNAKVRSKFIDIPVSAIKRDGYQRDLIGYWVEKIANGWDEQLYNPPKVIHYPGQDPEYLVYDGQHTTEGFKALIAAHGLDPDVEKMTVFVGAKNLSLDAAAELFLRTNKGREAVVSYDQYRASIVALEDWALWIDGVTTKHGLEVVRRVEQNKPQIAGVSNMKTIVLKGDVDLLDLTIKIFAASWPVTMPNRFWPYMIEGAALLIRDCKLAGWDDARIERVFANGLAKADFTTVRAKASDVAMASAVNGRNNPRVWSWGLASLLWKTTRPVPLSKRWGDVPTP